MMTRFLFACLALALAACSTATVRESSDVSSTVRAERGSIAATLVLPATVQAGVQVQITAPAPASLPDGLVLERTLVKPGRRVPQHFPVAMARATGFALVAPLSDTALLRLYSVPEQATGQIKEGPGPFPCPLADRVPQPAPDALSLICLIPPDFTVYAGMPALMAVRTASAENVIVLPVEAVAGSSQHGQVWIVDSRGQKRRQDVELGITDGVQIEIRSGISEGDSVLLPAPDLDRP